GDLVALDDDSIVSVLLDGGGKSTLESDAGSTALLETDLGAVSVVAGSPIVSLHLVGQPGHGARFAQVAAVTSRGRYVYIADSASGAVLRFDAGDLANPVTVASWSRSSTLKYLAADDQYVYLLTTSASGGVISRASLF
ncbi:MAG: hypothetical protein ACREJX_21195, partial [Polyangiaceae bacterium]